MRLCRDKAYFFFSKKCTHETIGHEATPTFDTAFEFAIVVHYFMLYPFAFIFELYIVQFFQGAILPNGAKGSFLGFVRQLLDAFL